MGDQALKALNELTTSIVESGNEIEDLKVQLTRHKLETEAVVREGKEMMQLILKLEQRVLAIDNHRKNFDGQEVQEIPEDPNE